jgi:hypothetical protein
MRVAFVSLSALILAASAMPAVSQTSDAGATQSTTATTSMTTSSSQTKTELSKAEAKHRIEQAGYSQVTALMKGADGVWHAKAMKNGQASDVSVDLSGNVSPA